MTHETLKPDLWTPRSAAQTIDVYDKWAQAYDSDLAEKRYLTPARLAEALAPHLPQDARPVLDFGCGTGLSGAALAALDIGPLHGTDITQAMLDQAAPKGLYDTLWHAEPGVLKVTKGTYRAIVATGVVSLGAAPPETMDLLLDALAPGDLLAMSFNDPTLEDGSYDAHLSRHLDCGRACLVSRAHGPHLEDIGMGSDVMVLRAT